MPPYLVTRQKKRKEKNIRIVEWHVTTLSGATTKDIALPSVTRVPHKRRKTREFLKKTDSSVEDGVTFFYVFFFFRRGEMHSHYHYGVKQVVCDD